LATAIRALSARVKRGVRRHLFSLLMVLFSSWVLFTVPQVQNLWMQAPPTIGWLWAEYFLFVAGLAWFYVPALVLVVPWASPRSHVGLRVLGAPASLSASWLPAVARSLTRGMAFGIGAALVMAAALIWGFGSSVDTGRLYLLAGALCRIVGTLTGLIGGWFIWWSWRFKSEARGTPAAVDATGRTLGWAVVGTALGETLWALAAFERLDVSFRLYSVWALVHICSCLIIGSSLVDFCHLYTPWPVRQAAFVVLILLLWGQSPRLIADREAPKLDPPVAPRSDWYDHALARLQGEGPAVIVVPSGGGSRAAIFTALVLECLARTPTPDWSPPTTGMDGSTVARQSTSWADRIFLISSVSGGSLATAEYVARGGGTAPVVPDLRQTSRAELTYRMRQHLEKLLRELRENQDSDESMKSYITKVELASRTAADIDNSDARWILECASVDDMSTDFMAPVLRGVFTPGATRGDTLSHFWNQKFGWRNIYRNVWNRDTDVFDPSRHPLMFLNAADVDDGCRLVIDFPPLPKNLFEAGRARGRVTLREPRSLSELEADDTCGLSLARAVRLSSNFPWGFHVLTLNEHSVPPLTEATKVRETGRSTVRILDGGVVDNTGIDSVYHLVRSLEDVRASDADSSAGRLLGELRRRGVVIIEIDSGAKPIAQQESGPLAGVKIPMNSLNNALYGSAERTKVQYRSEMTKLLQRRLDDPLPSQANGEPEHALVASRQQHLARSVFWFTFYCNHVQAKDAEVMTAWALGPADKAVVLAQFLANLQDWLRIQESVVSGLNEAEKSYRLEQQAVRLFVLERLISRLRKLQDDNRRYLREFTKLWTSQPRQAAAAMEVRDRVIDNIRTQHEVVTQAYEWAGLAKADSNLQQELRQVADRIEEQVVELADAKGVRVETIMRLAELPESVQSEQGLNAIATEVAIEATKMAQESRGLSKGVQAIQKQSDERSQERQQFYRSRGLN